MREKAQAAIQKGKPESGRTRAGPQQGHSGAEIEAQPILAPMQVAWPLIAQRAESHPASLTPPELGQLQHTIGMRAVQRLVATRHPVIKHQPIDARASLQRLVANRGLTIQRKIDPGTGRLEPADEGGLSNFVANNFPSPQAVLSTLKFQEVDRLYQRLIATNGQLKGKMKADRNAPWSRLRMQFNLLVKKIRSQPADADTRRELSAMLVRTGRAQGGMGVTPVKAKDRSEESNRLAEESAAKVLAGLESATQANQKETEPTAPLSHAVSAHGPGTDQYSRLLHGRRNDELVEDQKGGMYPQQAMTLSGNQSIGSIKAPNYVDVGSDPKNRSGAFTSSQGMLHTIQEGFAQASQISADEDRRRYRNDSGGLKLPGVKGGQQTGDLAGTTRSDDNPLAINVSGRSRDEELGYSLGIEGMTPQHKGFTLTPDEMQERYMKIKRTGEQNRARLILKPATTIIRDSQGREIGRRRAGWNLQSAYPNSDPTSNPELVRLGMIVTARKKDVSTCREKAGAARIEADSLKSNIHALQVELDRLSQPFLQIGSHLPPGDQIRVALETREQELKAIPVSSDEGSDMGFGLFSDDVDQSAMPALSPEEEENEQKRTKLEGEIKTLKTIQGKQEAINNRRLGSVSANSRFDTANDALQQAEAALQAAQQAYDTANGNQPQSASDLETSGETTGSDDNRGLKAGYNPATGQYEGDRPPKPKEMVVKDKTLGDLTAHHLYPYNKIKDDFNEALQDRSGVKLKALLMFAEVDLPAEFWQELKKDPRVRNYRFSEQVNHLAPKVVWARHNIFMGPGTEIRGDDPHEGLDVAYKAGGKRTKASWLALLITKTGGLTATDDMNERVKHLNVADKDQFDSAFLRWVKNKTMSTAVKALGKQARAYKAEDWEKEGGKYMQKHRPRH